MVSVGKYVKESDVRPFHSGSVSFLFFNGRGIVIILLYAGILGCGLSGKRKIECGVGIMIGNMSS